MVVQDVLAWALPPAVSIKRTSYVVQELEKNVGSILGLQYMTVTPSFFEKHVVGRSISEKERDRLRFPIVVMHLQGDNATDTATDIANHFNESFKRDMMHVKVFASESAVEKAIKLWFPDEPDRVQNCEGLVFLYPTGKVVGREENLPRFYLEARGVRTALESCFTKDVGFLLIKPRAVKERMVGTILRKLDVQYLPIHGLKLVKLNDYPSNSAWSCDSSSNECDTSGNPLGVAVVIEMKEDHSKLLSEFDKSLFYFNDNWQAAWSLCNVYFPFGFVFCKDKKSSPILESSLTGLL